jgi:ATP-dependent Clp endopeptidase proteolytic subunit ClpP
VTTPPRDKRATRASAEADCYVAWAERDRAQKRLLDVDRKISELELKEAQRADADLAAGADQSRIFTFYGEVTEESVSAAIEVLGMWSRRDPGQDISLILNSCGGSCIDGIALYDFLMHLRAQDHHIEIVALGEASSMGGIILQAADWRVMGSTSELLIHEISADQLGSRTLSWIEDRAAYLRKLNRRMDVILADRAHMSLEEIEEKQKNHDWFLDADEALALGFIDEVR